MTRRDLTRLDATRVLRAVAVFVICVVTAISVSGCGAVHALVGIHEAPKAKPAAVPLTSERATAILGRVMTAAYLGETKTGPAAKAQLRTAYTREGLRGAEGRVRLARLRPEVKTSPLLVPGTKLLAVSRGYGFPRFIVAQTVASDGGLPVLHLLTSPDAATPYKISTSVEMVPPVTVKPFDPLSVGSPLLANGTGRPVAKGTGLAVAPTTLLNRYAARLTFPPKAVSNPPFVTDSYSNQLRAAAAGAAKAVASQATFTQVHTVVPHSVYAVRQAGGDALVFGVIQRTDSFAVKAAQRVRTSANKAFVLLTGKKMVTKAARITTLEFVAFAVPRSTGKATLVAAREQIVAGSGS
jgi:hypothetical protein